MKKTMARSGSSPVRTYRKLLLYRKGEFLVALGINLKRLAELGQDSGADPEQISQEESVRLRLNGLLHGQLRQIERELDRLDLGEGGHCLACDTPIAPNRLQAVPGTQYCPDCQAKSSAHPAPELVGVGKET